MSRIATNVDPLDRIRQKMTVLGMRGPQATRPTGLQTPTDTQPGLTEQRDDGSRARIEAKMQALNMRTPQTARQAPVIARTDDPEAMQRVEQSRRQTTGMVAPAAPPVAEEIDTGGLGPDSAGAPEAFEAASRAIVGLGDVGSAIEGRARRLEKRVAANLIRQWEESDSPAFLQMTEGERSEAAFRAARSMVDRGDVPDWAEEPPPTSLLGDLRDNATGALSLAGQNMVSALAGGRVAIGGLLNEAAKGIESEGGRALPAKSLRVLANLIGPEEAKGLLAGNQETIRQIQEKMPARSKEAYTADWWVTQAITTAPTLLAGLAAGLATGGAAAPAVVIGLLEGGTIAEDVYSQQVERGVSEEEASVDAAEAMLIYGPLAGIVETFLGVGPVLGRTGLGKGAVGRIGTAAAGEGTEEAVQGALAEVVTSQITDQPIEEGFIERRIQELAVGGALGGVLRGGGEVGRAAGARAAAPTEEEGAEGPALPPPAAPTPDLPTDAQTAIPAPAAPAAEAPAAEAEPRLRLAGIEEPKTTIADTDPDVGTQEPPGEVEPEPRLLPRDDVMARETSLRRPSMDVIVEGADGRWIHLRDNQQVAVLANEEGHAMQAEAESGGTPVVVVRDGKVKQVGERRLGLGRETGEGPGGIDRRTPLAEPESGVLFEDDPTAPTQADAETAAPSPAIPVDGDRTGVPAGTVESGAAAQAGREAVQVPQVETPKQFRERVSAISPEHARISNDLDKLWVDGTMSRESVDVVLEVIAGVDPKALESLTRVRSSKRMTSSLGQATTTIIRDAATGITTKESDIALKKGIERARKMILAEDSGATKGEKKYWSSGVGESSIVFLHELGHVLQNTHLTDAENSLVREVYKSQRKSKWAAHFDKGLTPGVINTNEYLSKSEQEFFAQSFAEWAMTNRVSDARLEPLFKKIGKVLVETMARLRKRGNIAELEPLFEKLVAGGKFTPAALTQEAKRAERDGKETAVQKPDAAAQQEGAAKADQKKSGDKAEAPVSVPPVAPDRASLKGVEGRTGTLELPDGRSLNVTYRVVEADTVLPSHDATKGYKPNVGADPNERRYDDPTEGEASRKTVRAIARMAPNKRALLVTDTPSATDGPPIVGPTGIVLGGNARAMGVQLAYSRDTGGSYREGLEGVLGGFDVDPAAVAKMKQPILVRVLSAKDAGKPGELSRVLNEPLTTGRSSVTDAVSRGSRLTDDAITSIVLAIGDGTVRNALSDGPSASKIIRAFRESGAFSDTELEGFLKGGEVTDAGKNAIEQALLGAAIGDVRAMAEMPPSVSRALIASLGPIVRLNRTGENKGDPSFKPALSSAVEGVADFRRSSAKTLGEYVEQATLTPRPWLNDPRAFSLMRLFSEKKPTEVRERLQRLADGVDNAQSGQGTLLGDVPTVEGAWRTATDGYPPVPRGAFQRKKLTRSRALEYVRRTSGDVAGLDAEATKQLIEMQDSDFGSMRLPMNAIENIMGESAIDNAKAQRYANKRGDAPPILVGLVNGKLTIIDGKHRWAAARIRGDTHIDVFAPLNYVVNESTIDYSPPTPDEQTAQALRLRMRKLESALEDGKGKEKSRARAKARLNRYKAQIDPLDQMQREAEEKRQFLKDNAERAVKVFEETKSKLPEAGEGRSIYGWVLPDGDARHNSEGTEVPHIESAVLVGAKDDLDMMRLGAVRADMDHHNSAINIVQPMTRDQMAVIESSHKAGTWFAIEVMASDNKSPAHYFEQVSDSDARDVRRMLNKANRIARGIEPSVRIDNFPPTPDGVPMDDGGLHIRMGNLARELPGPMTPAKLVSIARAHGLTAEDMRTAGIDKIISAAEKAGRKINPSDVISAAKALALPEGSKKVKKEEGGVSETLFAPPIPLPAARTKAGRLARGATEIASAGRNYLSEQMLRAIPGQAGTWGRETLQPMVERSIDKTKEVFGELRDVRIAAIKAIQHHPVASWNLQEADFGEIDYTTARIVDAVEGRIPLDDLSDPERRYVLAYRKVVMETGNILKREGFLQWIPPVRNTGRNSMEILEPGRLVEFEPTKGGRVWLRSPSNHLRDMYLNPSGPAWEAYIAAVADMNGINLQVARERASEITRNPFARIGPETARIFPKHPTHIRVEMPGGWKRVIPLLHTDPFAAVEALVMDTSMRVGFVSEFGQSFTQSPGLAEEQPTLQDRESEGGFADVEVLRGQFESHGGDPRAFEQLLRALSGLQTHEPLARPGTAAYETLEVVTSASGLIRSVLLSRAAVPNIPEWVGNIRAFGGSKRAVVALRDIVKPTRSLIEGLEKAEIVAPGEIPETGRELIDLLERMGVVGHDMAKLTINRDRWVQSMARIFGDRVIRLFGTRAAWTWQERHGAVTGLRMAIDMRNGKGSVFDFLTLRGLGFTRPESLSMMRGEGTNGDYITFARRFAARSNSTELTLPAEESRAVNNRHWRNWMWFTRYPTMKARTMYATIAAFTEASVEAKKNPTKENMKLAGAAAVRLGDLIAGTAASGAFAHLILAFVLGGTTGLGVALDDWREDPEDMAVKSFVYSMFGPIITSLVRVGTDKRIDTVWRASAGASVLADSLSVVAPGGLGDYYGMTPVERASKFAKRYTPISKPLAIMAAQIGLGQKDTELDVAISTYYRWRREQKIGSGGRFTPSATDADTKRFRRSMKRAENLIRTRNPLDPDTEKEIAKHLAIALEVKESIGDNRRARRSIGQSLRARRLFVDLKPEQQQAFIERYGQPLADRLIAYDDLLAEWARAISYGREQPRRR